MFAIWDLLPPPHKYEFGNEFDDINEDIKPDKIYELVLFM